MSALLNRIQKKNDRRRKKIRAENARRARKVNSSNNTLQLLEAVV